MKSLDSKIKYALELAFMAGRWRGQVDLEESMDNNSYFDAFLTSVHAKKSGGQCLHTVASDNLNSRPVRYNLRSDDWREGVKKETQKDLEEAINILTNTLQCKK
jgi:hypothetical protein